MTHVAAPQRPSLAAAIGPIALIPELTRFGLHPGPPKSVSR
jgi:hypothetical protein